MVLPEGQGLVHLLCLIVVSLLHARAQLLKYIGHTSSSHLSQIILQVEEKDEAGGEFSVHSFF